MPLKNYTNEDAEELRREMKELQAAHGMRRIYEAFVLENNNYESKKKFLKYFDDTMNLESAQLKIDFYNDPQKVNKITYEDKDQQEEVQDNDDEQIIQSVAQVRRPQTAGNNLERYKPGSVDEQDINIRIYYLMSLVWLYNHSIKPEFKVHAKAKIIFNKIFGKITPLKNYNSEAIEKLEEELKTLSLLKYEEMLDAEDSSFETNREITQSFTNNTANVLAKLRSNDLTSLHEKAAMASAHADKDKKTMQQIHNYTKEQKLITDGYSQLKRLVKRIKLITRNEKVFFADHHNLEEKISGKDNVYMLCPEIDLKLESLINQLNDVNLDVPIAFLTTWKLIQDYVDTIKDTIKREEIASSSVVVEKLERLILNNGGLLRFKAEAENADHKPEPHDKIILQKYEAPPVEVEVKFPAVKGASLTTSKDNSLDVLKDTLIDNSKNVSKDKSKDILINNSKNNAKSTSYLSISQPVKFPVPNPPRGKNPFRNTTKPTDQSQEAPKKNPIKLPKI